MNRLTSLGAAGVIAAMSVVGCQQDKDTPPDHTRKSQASTSSSMRQSGTAASSSRAETASSSSETAKTSARVTTGGEQSPSAYSSVNSGGATATDAGVASPAAPAAGSSASNSSTDSTKTSQSAVSSDPTATPAIAAQASKDAHPTEGAAAHLSPGVEGSAAPVTAPEAGAAAAPAAPTAAAGDPTNPAPTVAPATPAPEAANAAPATAAPAAPAAEPAAAKEKEGDHAEHHGAMATIEPAKGAQQKVTGHVHFTSAGEHGVKVVADLKGLTPNSKHGFHIHEKADLSAPDLKSAGGHFNPTMSKHGGPEGEMRHGGDLGNIQADAEGNAHYEVTVHGLTIDGAKDGVIGRSVLVHEKADDMKTDPAGDSGARIAGGVIKAAKGDKSESADAAAPQAQPAAAAAPAAPTELNK